MSRRGALEITLLPGARELLAAHASALPQRDDLCGAFCGALALAAAGLHTRAGEPLDQDAVALAAGSVVSEGRDPHTLPHGETGRRDYRLSLPTIDDPEVSGTTAAGVVEALAELSEQRLAAIPLAGPWSAAALGGAFDLAAALSRPATLIANLATRHLWGGGAGAVEMLDHLLDGTDAGPAPDWDVGHFVCVAGRVQGPAGRLYLLADTYPALGHRGLHWQPEPRLATAIERRDMPAGGVIAVVLAEDAPAVRDGAGSLGLREELWDNGTVAPEVRR